MYKNGATIRQGASSSIRNTDCTATMSSPSDSMHPLTAPLRNFGVEDAKDLTPSQGEQVLADLELQLERQGAVCG